MANVCQDILNRIKGLQVPTSGDKVLRILLGFINIFLFGIGMIILGALDSDLANVLIGVMQLCIPFVGWIWAVVWGILIIVKAL